MPDIAMCAADRLIGNKLIKCERRMECYRHTAPHSMLYQTYMETPLIVKDGMQECEYFWEDKRVIRKPGP